MEVTNIDESWYSDFFVDDYMSMVNEQKKDCHCFSSEFVNKYNSRGLEALKRIIKRMVSNPLFLYHTLIFQVLKNNHWTIAAADTKKHTIKYYDSLGRDDRLSTGSIVKFLQQWQEHLGISISNWKVKRAHSPLQTNTFDSGPWILQTAKCIVLRAPLMFDQNMMQSIRITQKMELENKELCTINYKKIYNKNKKNKRKLKKQIYKMKRTLTQHSQMSEKLQIHDAETTQ